MATFATVTLFLGLSVLLVRRRLQSPSVRLARARSR